MNRLQSIRPETVRDILADALRLLSGTGKRFSVAQLADAALLGETTVKSYRDGRQLPTLDAALRLMAVLGPGFASAVLAPAGLKAVEVDPDKVTLFEVNAENGALCALMAAALRDGRFDHQEIARLRPQLEELRQALDAVLALGGAADTP